MGKGGQAEWGRNACTEVVSVQLNPKGLPRDECKACLEFSRLNVDTGSPRALWHSPVGLYLSFVESQAEKQLRAPSP